MTLEELYRTAYRSCAEKAAEDSLAFDLSLLFEHVMGFSRYQLALVGKEQADEGKAQTFFSLCGRYADGYPLQYLLGEWEFWGLSFRVGEGVLIPRPDTEILVQTALELLRGKERPAIADLCAGSGCIACAIARERHDASVYALELSDAAFSYLTENIARNHADIHAVHCDVFTPPALPPLDLVVSNPPYIPRKELDTLQKQVLFEPELALCGGEDGLDFYRSLPPRYLPLLKPGGAVAFETGYNQAHAVAELLASNGFRQVETRKDFAGIERVVYGFTH